MAWLLLVVLAAATALAYGLKDRPEATQAAPDLAPLIERASFEQCVGPVALQGQGLPDVRLPCLDGSGVRSLVSSAPIEQVPTIVNVYGSWCRPCAEEMPLLRQLHQRAGSRLQLLGIDTEDEPRLGLLFAIDFGQRWPALRDDDGLVSRALGGGAPKTVFIDASGKVVHVERAGYRDLAALRADVLRYLKLAV